jgi:hypothetical protein
MKWAVLELKLESAHRLTRPKPVFVIQESHDLLVACLERLVG